MRRRPGSTGSCGGFRDMSLVLGSKCAHLVADVLCVCLLVWGFCASSLLLVAALCVTLTGRDVDVCCGGVGAVWHELGSKCAHLVADVLCVCLLVWGFCAS